TRAAFGIVGVTGGVPFSANSCLGPEWQWAVSTKGAPSYYMNMSDPGTASPHWTQPGPRPCSGSAADAGCAYNYGWNAAAFAFAYAASQTGAQAAATHAWWIDVETANTWSTGQSLNVAVIQGALAYANQHTSKAVGIYSPPYQWGVITGGVHLNAPVWAAGASSAATAPSSCGAGFTGKPVKVVQYPAGAYDGDYRCH
ncbi:MAG: hypothetical protein JO265_00130, partial [Acidimicrobiia bacterium]|nr:hypothetical protein [Acidimicrobiia bacterium]